MTEIHDRVTRLEEERAEVRFLATHADKEAASNTAVLQGQIGVLNALRETQQEHGQTLAKHGQILAKHTHMLTEHGKRLDRLEHKVDAGFAQADKNFDQINKNFAKVDENFAKVEGQLKQVRTGIAKITGLLTDEIDKREET
jgi:septal ring factor EnvC (AmiA/AmiB activator)